MPYPGDLLGDRYRLDDRIAAGGMGEVWRATDTVLGRPVAVKTLLAGYAGDAGFRSRFQHEARAMASLRHGGVAPVYDFGETGEGAAYLVMARVDGVPLNQWIAEHGPLTADETMSIVSRGARALAAAHAAGIVHRDVKPGNLIIEPDGNVVLVDFGVARSAQSVTLTGAREVVGTALYIAPEQVSKKATGPAADLYALGAVAYHCLAGRPPFLGDNPLAVALQHLDQEPPPLPTSVPAQVRELVATAMAKNPADRFPSAVAMAEAAEAASASPGATSRADRIFSAPAGASAAAAGAMAGAAGNVGMARGDHPTSRPAAAEPLAKTAVDNAAGGSEADGDAGADRSAATRADTGGAEFGAASGENAAAGTRGAGEDGAANSGAAAGTRGAGEEGAANSGAAAGTRGAEEEGAAGFGAAAATRHATEEGQATGLRAEGPAAGLAAATGIGAAAGVDAVARSASDADAPGRGSTGDQGSAGISASGIDDHAEKNAAGQSAWEDGAGNAGKGAAGEGAARKHDADVVPRFAAGVAATHRPGHLEADAATAAAHRPSHLEADAATAAAHRPSHPEANAAAAAAHLPGRPGAEPDVTAPLAPGRSPNVSNTEIWVDSPVTVSRNNLLERRKLAVLGALLLALSGLGSAAVIFNPFDRAGTPEPAVSTPAGDAPQQSPKPAKKPKETQGNAVTSNNKDDNDEAEPTPKRSQAAATTGETTRPTTTAPAEEPTTTTPTEEPETTTTPPTPDASEGDE